MMVRELIEKLLTMPADASVLYVWDGEARSEVTSVWLARSGDVIMAERGQYVYSENSRPPFSPLAKRTPYGTAP
jgi:hypothetical protein